MIPLACAGVFGLAQIYPFTGVLISVLHNGPASAATAVSGAPLESPLAIRWMFLGAMCRCGQPTLKPG
ncbi:hypothetical protein DXZ20_29780 [Leptolyngbyaceae cyanobacterium CCMR0081]|uniref:Uncharacterized protein n=1 Tax=Adonisia turfae CCMR0081 TaxID=2292702 RepID=A0A6M0RU30_9CYAN|nr:hypothetical protein [Adonisia turfae CCMR0081]